MLQLYVAFRLTSRRRNQRYQQERERETVFIFLFRVVSGIIGKCLEAALYFFLEILPFVCIHFVCSKRRYESSQDQLRKYGCAMILQSQRAHALGLEMLGPHDESVERVRKTNNQQIETSGTSA